MTEALRLDPHRNLWGPHKFQGLREMRPGALFRKVLKHRKGRVDRDQAR